MHFKALIIKHLEQKYTGNQSKHKICCVYRHNLYVYRKTCGLRTEEAKILKR